MLKISFSTPRRVLKVAPELGAPKALPRPAPRTWRRIKRITAAPMIIWMTRIAGSHCCKTLPRFHARPFNAEHTTQPAESGHRHLRSQKERTSRDRMTFLAV